jgi:hypothetical protein
MIYLKKTAGGIQYPYSLAQLKQDNPNTSFSEFINNESLAEFEVFVVQKVLHANAFGKIYIELEPEWLNEIYYQRWQETDDDAGRIEFLKQTRWSEIRSIRNQLLKDTDFTMLEDFPQSETKRQEWKQYRQELRDVTIQSDVFNINWPVQPI